MRRWMPRALVGLTAALVLGVGGYAGQAWWAKRLAAEILESKECIRSVRMHANTSSRAQLLLERWKETPWQGDWNFDNLLPRHDGSYTYVYGTFGHRWLPRRTLFEYAKLLTGQSLPDDPDVWEAWFREHHDQAWDDQPMRCLGFVTIDDYQGPRVKLKP